MNVKNREKESADAYLKFLQSKGVPTRMLYLHSRFLDAFMLNLKDKDQTRKAYAQALESTRSSLSKEDKGEAITISREYFPFWANDIKAIALFEKKYGFNAEMVHWEPSPKSLKSLQSAVTADIYTIHENQILSSYLEKIGKVHRDISTIKKHTELAKILLIRLRDAPEKNHEFYRKAVDVTLPLFEGAHLKQLYLDAAREFYESWKSTAESFT